MVSELDARLTGQRETAHHLLDAARAFEAGDWQAGRSSIVALRNQFEHLTG